MVKLLLQYLLLESKIVSSSALRDIRSLVGRTWLLANRSGVRRGEQGPRGRRGAGRASTASVKLAADILQGSDLGRAYHPLLASIEARLLHLQSEKLDVPLADVPVS